MDRGVCAGSTQVTFLLFFLLFTLQDTDSDDETSCNSKVPPPNSSQTLRGESACIQICSLEFLPLKCLIIILSNHWCLKLCMSRKWRRRSALMCHLYFFFFFFACSEFCVLSAAKLKQNQVKQLGQGFLSCRNFTLMQVYQLNRVKKINKQKTKHEHKKQKQPVLTGCGVAGVVIIQPSLHP